MARSGIHYTEPEEVLPVHSHELGALSRMENLDTKYNDHMADDFGSHKKCRKMTRTKWDKFAPYAFSKLDKDAKIETFLQLYEDYNNLKLRLNEEMDRNKKMTARIVSLEAEMAKVKTVSVLSPADRLRMEK